MDHPNFIVLTSMGNNVPVHDLQVVKAKGKLCISTVSPEPLLLTYSVGIYGGLKQNLESCPLASVSVVECLTRDRGAAVSSLTSVTVLCP